MGLASHGRRAMSASSATALVIGGGVVGRACALALQRDGWQVTLVDDDATSSAPSWGNAGHIATEQVAPLASLATLRSVPRRWHGVGGPLDVREPLRCLPWLLAFLRACTPARFAVGQQAMRSLLADALPAWQRLIPTLGAPALLQEHGHWVCWEQANSARRGAAAWQAADTGTATCAPLTPAQHAALQAPLSIPIAGGIAFDGTAQIADLPALALRLTLAFQQAGGVFLREKVCRLQHHGRRVHAVTAAGQRIDADRVLVCAGVRSRSLLEPLGLRTPLVAERGYHLQWRRHAWPALPPVVFEDRALILTRFGGGVRAASFVEFAGQDTPPDPRKWARLQRHVTALGIPVEGVPVPWIGARPTLPDYLPALGCSQRFDNLAYAFGHQHLGLTLAALSGELLAALCAERPLAVDVSPFALERFG